MRKKIDHPLLKGLDVELKTDPMALFNPHSVLVYGETAEKKDKKTFVVRAEDGRDILVVLKPKWYDPVPMVEIQGKKLQLVPPLAWYEIAWICIPLLLVAIGGAIGGGLGAAAAYTNAMIFRSELSAPLRYLISCGVTFSAVIIWIVISSFLASLWR